MRKGCLESEAVWIGLLMAAWLWFAPLRAQAPDPGEAAFQRGVAAYRDGNFGAALDSLREAGRLGFAQPNLHFNLGLVLYRLARYDESRLEFERLLGYPQYRPMAEFHLGLVAARVGDRERAKSLWQSVLANAPQPAMRERAREALARLEPAPAGSSAWVLASLGHDSNPALLDEAAQTSTTGSSGEGELFAAFDQAWPAAADRRLVAGGGLYLREYAEDNGLDQVGLFAALRDERDRDARRRTWSIDAGTNRLEGERFTDQYGVGFESRPLPAASGLTINGQAAWIATVPAYGYLEGWRLRAGVGHGTVLGRARLRIAYQFEFNYREDLRAGIEFFSHSPLRNQVGVALSQPLTGPWELGWDARYRYSRWLDRDRFDDGGTLRESRRQDSLVHSGARLRYALGANSKLLLEGQFSRNHSSVDAYDYARTRVLLGYEWNWAGG